MAGAAASAAATSGALRFLGGNSAARASPPSFCCATSSWLAPSRRGTFARAASVGHAVGVVGVRGGRRVGVRGPPFLPTTKNRRRPEPAEPQTIASPRAAPEVMKTNYFRIVVVQLIQYSGADSPRGLSTFFAR